MFRKTSLLRISVLISEVVTFWSKGEFLGEFPRKYFKLTEKHSLAVCGPFGEKYSYF